MNKGAKATNTSAMLADIVNGLSDDQVVEFMANEGVVKCFLDGEEKACEDQAEFITAIDNWDDDFKEAVYACFKEADNNWWCPDRLLTVVNLFYDCLLWRVEAMWAAQSLHRNYQKRYLEMKQVGFR